MVLILERELHQSQGALITCTGNTLRMRKMRLLCSRAQRAHWVIVFCVILQWWLVSPPPSHDDSTFWLPCVVIHLLQQHERNQIKNRLYFSHSFSVDVGMWRGHVTTHTHLQMHTHSQWKCMIHSSIERAGMIHPDPNCGSDIKADAATVQVTRVSI